MSDTTSRERAVNLFDRALRALQEAAAGVVAERLRTGAPLVVWHEGRVVRMRAEDWLLLTMRPALATEENFSPSGPVKKETGS